MKTGRDSTGRFTQRPYFKDEEFESITSSALQAVDLLPRSPEPIRIDRFIEKSFGLECQYEDLPSGVLGEARFGPSGVIGIYVSRDIGDDTATGERRVRTTLAHECGHCLLHAHLIALGEAAFLLDRTIPGVSRVLCRGENVLGGVVGQCREQPWYEWQANRAMSALLLPKTLFLAAAGAFTREVGSLGRREFEFGRLDEAGRVLGEIFEVNPVVARFRVEQLFPRTSGGQLCL